MAISCEDINDFFENQIETLTLPKFKNFLKTHKLKPEDCVHWVYTDKNDHNWSLLSYFGALCALNEASYKQNAILLFILDIYEKENMLDAMTQPGEPDLLWTCFCLSEWDKEFNQAILQKTGNFFPKSERGWATKDHNGWASTLLSMQKNQFNGPHAIDENIVMTNIQNLYDAIILKNSSEATIDSVQLNEIQNSSFCSYLSHLEMLPLLEIEQNDIAQQLKNHLFELNFKINHQTGQELISWMSYPEHESDTHFQLTLEQTLTVLLIENDLHHLIEEERFKKSIEDLVQNYSSLNHSYKVHDFDIPHRFKIRSALSKLFPKEYMDNLDVVELPKQWKTAIRNNKTKRTPLGGSIVGGYPISKIKWV